jgi:hypothetical protein
VQGGGSTRAAGATPLSSTGPPADTGTVKSRTRSIEIAATPTQVFSVLAAFLDPPPFAEIIRTSERDGKGAVYAVRGRAYGIPFHHLFMIDTYTPPHALSFSSNGRVGAWWSVVYMIEPRDTGALLTAAITVQLRGRWRLMSPLLGHALNRATKDALTRARSHAEHATDHPLVQAG